ncbi:copper transport protein 86 [[Candida] jaroonii]|uniref:Copper transport protein 86 n=1 Tax=[Candida] jaroonii TaxID=467808 RepID=A0ACA9Y6W7_9ASCO|nr:copper transport protein 86 [[Candida] jaroonii]
MLLRNVCIESVDVDGRDIVNDMAKFQTTNEFGERVRCSYYELLANLSHHQYIDNLGDVVDDSLPYAVAVSNNVDKDVGRMFEDDLVVQYLFDCKFDDMNEIESKIFNCLEKIIVHESFGKWFVTQKDQLKLLKVVQLIVPEKSWDNYELIGLLSWLHPLLVKLSEDTIDSFHKKDYVTLETIHPKLVVVVDCLSELGKFNIAKDFMINYNFLDTLIPLLGTIHVEIKPKNMMKKISSVVSFPHIKSMIIEIISYLSYENFEVQEKVRQLGGLQVILSNCVIDDDNPYIKERSIIALKFLLAGNSSNQKIVGDLEAKKAVDNDVLEQVGYEVEVDNGEIKMKRR